MEKETSNYRLRTLSEQELTRLSRVNTRKAEKTRNQRLSSDSRKSKFFDYEEVCHEQYKTRKSKKVEYINLPASFDIENTSFYDERGNKCSILYAWVFCLNGKCVFGRNWQDFRDLCLLLRERYELNEKKILPVYIQNLSHEFSFFCKRFKWLEVFATDERRPIRCLSSVGIEFRDSYILAAMSLASIGKNLQTYKIEKMKGDLDYKLLRHEKTKLTPKEWHYIENDGLVLNAFVKESMERNNDNVCDIPLTNTGYVRRYLKNECYHDGQKGHGSRRKTKSRSYGVYRAIIKRLTLTPEEYLQAKDCFMGGFTHANVFNVGLVFENVASYDLTSAYPAAMVLEHGYPMGTGTYIKAPTREEIDTALKLYACVFVARLWGVKSRYRGDNFISASKCRNLKGDSQDNGRISKADYLETTITNIDLEIIRAAYTFEKIEIADLWKYPRGYLPRSFIKGVLGLYADKTTLKGVKGMEKEYMVKKGMLNACFGCCVTAVDRQQNKYENGVWFQEPANLKETIEKYNNTPNRFLFYLWGCFITAYVRKVIAKVIMTELKDDYIYADTDSVKFKNHEEHRAYFEAYNKGIDHKIEASAKANNLPMDLYMPKTKDGKRKPIGYFDYEETFRRFKTLGAKRYMVEESEEKNFHEYGKIITPYSLTISGVNKSTAIPALIEKAEKEGKDIFDYFNIGFEFDETMAGKNTHTYIDTEREGYLTDYQGVKCHYHEFSGVHLEATTYKLTTTEEYYEQLYLDEMQRVIRRENMKL